MALARARQAARRVKDRWKAKAFYNITAPVAFNQANLGETFADESQKLLGRTVETTLNELTGDLKQMHVKLTFQVSNIQDNQAQTTFVGHAMTSDYVRRLTRRGNTKIPLVVDLQTKDGSRIRVKPFAITDRRSQTTQAQEIRQIMQRMLTESASKNSLSGFLADMLVGDLNNRIYKEARKVHPLRRIEIARSEMLGAPTVEVDETPVIMPQVDEPEESEAETTAADSEDEAAEKADDSEE